MSRWLLLTALSSMLVLHFACSDDGGSNNGVQCSDGKDNDGDGMIDFPADLGCTGEDDENEDDAPSAQCSDGRDNDGDGKHDYPNDPGCFAPNQDSEEDDCPDGPACPQCSNGKDDDGNGVTDFPSDNGGCSSASDLDEFTHDPVACGAGVNIKPLPFTGMDTGMLMAGAQSNLTGACGGTGTEVVYEIRALVPKVIVATTNLDTTTADTVLYLRSADCTDMSQELLCNDNIDTSDDQSTLTVSISTPGTYYLVVDSKDSLGGAYELKVNYFIGEGTMCLAPDECGPGLVCRVKKGDTMKTCSKHICEDGLDEDNDGKNDYPDDPGCTALTDDTEDDGCPGVGPDCPECGDGVNNDADSGTDYGGAMPDTTCTSASSASESCVSTDGVASITMAQTMDTNVGANDDVHLPPGTNFCTSSSNTAPDKTYRLDLPPMQNLSIVNTNTFSASVALFDSTCGGTPIVCDSIPDDVVVNTALPAGAYYYVVDGFTGPTNTGTYTITVSGNIQNGASCESTLAQAGAITCGIGYTCQGTAPNRTCQPAACSDGVDNEPSGSKDSKIDFPNDPGCDSPGDNDETNPGTLPVCSDGVDNDNPTDGQTDYPADYGCSSAVGTSETFCSIEVDATSKITTKTTTGDTAAKMGNYKNSCNSSSSTAASAPDVAYALQLPVPVATLQVDTIGSQFDTTVEVRSPDCVTSLKCDDEGGGSNTSKVILTGVAPGGYAITIDGWSTGKGPYTLNVQGTVSQGTICSSPLFTGGANAVLLCPAGTTCKGTPTPKCLP